MEIKILPYEELTRDELYDLLKIRSEIFVVEQNCVYQDLDGADKIAYHLVMVDNGRIVGTARIFKAGLKAPEVSFGRFCIEEEYRERGHAHDMVNEIHSFIIKTFGSVPVRIEAQLHLQAFYSRHGYHKDGAPYVLDGIDHLHMLRPGF